MAELRRTPRNVLPGMRDKEDAPYARAYAMEAEPETASGLVDEYLQVLVRHKALILRLALIGLVVSILLTFTTQPVYQTRTSLNIESLNSEFMNMKSVDPTASVPMDTVVQTQIKLLESDTLAERVQERLTSEPHPAGVLRSDWLSASLRLLHLGGKDTIPFATVLAETANNTKIKPLGLTQLVEITCDSWNPQIAVAYCNTLTSEFQQQDLESRGQDARRTSDWLMHQASDIRQKAEESQQKLIAATGGNGLILTEQSSNVGTDALRALQTELIKAQADRMEKEAEIKSAEASSGDAMPRSVQSAGYAAQKSKLLDLQQQVSALVPPLTEANPRVIHLRAQISELQRGLDQETSNNQARLLNEYEAAKHREQLLRMSYDAKQGSVSSDLEKATAVDLLRREVQSEQQLYQTLLQRAKEAGFASAMQATTIRVVDAARKPLLPVYPRRVTLALAGTLVGLVAGVCFALLRDRRSGLLHAPGETGPLLQVDELGVVPSPRALMRPPTPGIRGALRLSRSSAPTLKHVYEGRDTEDFALLAEAYRGITHSILLADRRADPRVYVVTSPNANEGKTTVVSHLGVALSHRGQRTLLIDADLRKPTLHTNFDLENTTGFSDVLQENEDVTEEFLHAIQQTSYPGLDVLTSGRKRRMVSDALHSKQMEPLLRSFSQTYDVILLDTPPMLHITDARVLATRADAAILVFRAGVTTREQALAAQALLQRDDVPVIGSILNDFNPGRAGKYGYYNSYYAYQGSTDAGTERR